MYFVSYCFSWDKEDKEYFPPALPTPKGFFLLRSNCISMGNVKQHVSSVDFGRKIVEKKLWGIYLLLIFNRAAISLIPALPTPKGFTIA